MDLSRERVIEVTLDRYESLEASMEGSRRRLRAIYSDLAQPLGYHRDHWGKDIEGAGAELAFAKAMRLYWHASTGPQRGTEGDACGWEVRWTDHAAGKLLVYDVDRDDAPYVLVTGAIPTYQVVGYMLGRDAKDRERFWNAKARVPCYWIPQAALTPLSGYEGPWPE